MTTELVPQQTITDIIEAKMDCLKIYAEIDALKAKKAKIEERFFSGVHSHYNHWSDGVSFDNRGKYYDHMAWQIIINGCKLTNAMSESGKKKFLEKIEEDTPEFNALNIQGFVQNSEKMYNDGFKGLLKDVWKGFFNTSYEGGVWRVSKKDNLNQIKEKFITYGGFEWWDYNNHFRANYDRHWFSRWEDLWSLCHILDKKPKPNYANTFSNFCDDQLKHTKNHVSCKYFELKLYMNGNVHVKWKALHVLGMINQYGANGQLPDIMEKRYKEEHMNKAYYPKKPKPMKKTGNDKKDYQFYETPTDVISEMVSYVYNDINDNNTILEPSAGKGAIAQYLRNEFNVECDCVELNDDNRKTLELNGFSIEGRDFLDVKGNWDIVIGNPPFYNQQDIDHVYKMIEVANKHVVSVMSKSVMYRNNSKTLAFREYVKENNGYFVELPEGSFKESGTMVNTCLCIVEK